jgi:hypothetical protein
MTRAVTPIARDMDIDAESANDEHPEANGEPSRFKENRAMTLRLLPLGGVQHFWICARRAVPELRSSPKLSAAGLDVSCGFSDLGCCCAGLTLASNVEFAKHGLEPTVGSASRQPPPVPPRKTPYPRSDRGGYSGTTAPRRSSHRSLRRRRVAGRRQRERDGECRI